VTDRASRSTLGEWLRAAYAAEEAGCPPPEAFLAEEMEALAIEDRRRLESHAERCPACSAERDLAAAFASDAAVAAPADVDWVVARLRGGAASGNPVPRREVETSRSRPWSTWGRLAAAAVLVVAAGLAFQRLYPDMPALPPPPGGSDGVVRGGEVELVAPVGEVAAMPRELRWEAVPGASVYRVRLVTVDGTELWETRVSAPRAELPAEVTSRLRDAVSYRWEVEALAPGGAVAGRSILARFRVAPAPEPR
jgi:hypothetical protein